jgi:hypothetical protein
MRELRLIICAVDEEMTAWNFSRHLQK